MIGGNVTDVDGLTQFSVLNQNSADRASFHRAGMHISLILYYVLPVMFIRPRINSIHLLRRHRPRTTKGQSP